MVAAPAGHLSTLHWLHAHYPEAFRLPDARNLAARLGKLSALQALQAQKPLLPWDFTISRRIAHAGHLDVLQWLASQGSMDSEVCLIVAAERGHTHVLSWLRECSPVYFQLGKLTILAAACGSLLALKFLASMDPPCPMTPQATAAAASEGHLDIVKWLYAQQPPCPVGVKGLISAVEAGHDHDAEWLHKERHIDAALLAAQALKSLSFRPSHTCVSTIRCPS